MLMLLSVPHAAAVANCRTSASISLSTTRFYLGPNKKTLPFRCLDDSISSRIGCLFSMAQTQASPFSCCSKLDSKRALISLSNKKDLDLLGTGLQELGYAIVSTGGTAQALLHYGIPVTKVEEITRFPEMLDGRVKTLHPNIHGGILARREDNLHMAALNEHGIGTFDIVVVNLYPFYAKVTSVSGITIEDGIENIDIGGPTLIRAAAKNHKNVLVVVDPEDYTSLLEFLHKDQDNQHYRMTLAWKAFQYVASYDSAVSEWLWKQSSQATNFPISLTLPLKMKSALRYGENPHQMAAFYEDMSLSLVNAGGIATAIQHHGKEMSYNNYLDADAAWNCVSEFQSPTCVILLKLILLVLLRIQKSCRW
ncbi:hypothetical protein HPP92_009264 [Vanilla planifolia]|uniref:MGS-like domain-containing protein n=1 Tax=Vanilla planifolia TaxID=51239 RepID=A0A835RDZ7_VANPL|nr:hypothetical protein HPP92_009264 [Vanilla planifolia]